MRGGAAGVSPTPKAMTEVELTRMPRDRRLYTLDGIGSLRLQGLLSRSAIAEADGRTWRISGRGFWQRAMHAIDSSGAAVGAFEPNKLRRGGTLLWDGRELALRPASSWRERYALVDGDRELATLDGKGWGKRPVKVVVDSADAIEPGLLLFAAFVVRGLAEDASSAAGGASAATSPG